MEYRNQVLLLDNFRSILSSFSLDVQDVVRSAILDGVDLNPYIERFREDPYKLDQIRLGLKSGLDPVYFQLSGENIYKLRVLRDRGVNISEVETQIKKSNFGTANQEYVTRALRWLEAGYDISGLKISSIPLNLLNVFEQGLKNGISMVEFNNGKQYDSDYIKQCIQIRENGFSINRFLNEFWSLDVLRTLSVFSRSKNVQLWNALLGNIDSKTSNERVNLLIKLVMSRVSIEDLQKKNSNGVYVYDDACLVWVQQAFDKRLDYNRLIQETTDAEKMEELIRAMDLAKSTKGVSGRVRPNPRKLQFGVKN